MSGAQRLFAGIELSAEARTAIERALEPVRAAEASKQALRFIPSENWHVTLQFFGSVRSELVESVRDACRETAARAAACEIELGGYGAFSSPRRAGVIWLGVARGGEALARLADALASTSEPLGFERETRAYHPHVTLARAKPPSDVRALLAELAPLALPLAVHAIALFRSQLASTGARYEVLARYPFSMG